MKKLDDIPKKDFFTVPDQYFEAFPARVQARISKPGSLTEHQPFFLRSLKYALPVVVLLMGVAFWYSRTVSSGSTAPGVEYMLSAIQTEDLLAYLDDSSDLTTTEILETVNFNAEDLDDIEGAVYNLNIPDHDFEDMLDKGDVTNF